MTERATFRIKDWEDEAIGIGPEKKLLVAILIRALADLVTEDTRDKSRQHIRREALAWFSSTVRVPWSFLWLCDALEVDPEMITRRLPERRSFLAAA